LSDPGQTVKRHSWLAALLTFVVPGLGQLYLGRRAWAATFLLVPFALLAAGIMYSFAVFSGYVATIAAAVLFNITITANAWIAARAGVERTLVPRWFEYPLFLSAAIVLTIVVGDFLTNPNVQSPTGVRYRAYVAVSHSMVPSLLPGDYFVIARGAVAPVRDQIVAYHWRDKPKTTYVHRVVAVAGDAIDFTDGKLTLNNAVLAHRRLCALVDKQDGVSLGDFVEEGAGTSRRVVGYMSVAGDHQDLSSMVVPPGELVVLGDDRSVSLDSRQRGTVSAKDVVGVALYVVWSQDWSRIGLRLDETNDADEKRICAAKYNIFD